MYKLTSHAITQYSIRTGIKLLYGRADAEKALIDSLEASVVISHREALKRGFTVTPHNKNILRFWHNDCIDEDMLAIVRDNTVITVLLPKNAIHSNRHNHNAKIRYDMEQENRAAKGR